MPAARRRIVLSVSSPPLVVIVGLVVRARTSGDAAHAAKADRRASQRPVPVTLAKVEKKDVPVWLEGLGTVAAWQQVTVRAQVDGRLDKVLFTEGQAVQEGRRCWRRSIRVRSPRSCTRPRARWRATARSCTTRRSTSSATATLRGGKLIAQQQVDDQAALVGQAEGAVHVDEAQIETAQAQPRLRARALAASTASSACAWSTPATSCTPPTPTASW